jgi:zinc transporter ZupT
MHPILLSILLGLTAAAANVFGGAIIVQRRWERSYLKYFVALGAGFMLATAIVEVFPASLELRGKSAGFLVLVGYLIIHFFEHTVSPHFHFGEETHEAEFVHAHKGFSVLIGLLIDLRGHLPAQNSRGIHHQLGHAGQWSEPRNCLGRIDALGSCNPGGRAYDGSAST